MKKKYSSPELSCEFIIPDSSISSGFTLCITGHCDIEGNVTGTLCAPSNGFNHGQYIQSSAGNYYFCSAADGACKNN